ncbi:ClpP/crotonase [Clavulina sp. PMI_390]|nr:ClpP/crotonase [Clavulina sp. PMI_390]
MATSAVDGKFLKVSTPLEGIAVVSISRPPHNAFTGAMWREIPLVFNRLSSDSNIRVIVLASSERVFTAGLEVKDTGSELLSATSSDPSRTAWGLRALIQEFQAAVHAIEKCRVPVIAAVHGIAYGIALEILSACDIRYATSDACFAMKEVDIGMTSNVGLLARFPRITGNDSSARELAFTAKDFSAREALEVGFISKVVEGDKSAVLNAALETAKMIAAKSPVAISGIKHLFLHARDHSVQENLDYTATWNAGMLQTEDVEKSIEAFMKKKKASFKPLPKL